MPPPATVLWAASPNEAFNLIAERKIETPVWYPVLDQVRKTVADRIVKEIGYPLFNSIERSFSSLVLNRLKQFVGAQFRQSDIGRSHGCHGADSFGALEFFRDVLGIEAVERMRGIMQVAQSAGWWWPFAETCVITDRPSRMEFDGQRLLHSEAGPSISFRDGWELYAWHGVQVPPKVVLNPELLTIGEIEGMTNVEVRRVAIERFGTERFLRESHATRIHADEYGELYITRSGDEKIAMVKVVNATAEADGSFKNYFLRVPPHVTTAREAVAWTFGFEGKDLARYAPIKQT